MVSDEEPEVQVGREVLQTRHDLENDIEGVQIDNYENSGPRCMEGCRMRRVKRGGYYWIETQDNVIAREVN